MNFLQLDQECRIAGIKGVVCEMSAICGRLDDKKAHPLGNAQAEELYALAQALAVLAGSARFHYREKA